MATLQAQLEQSKRSVIELKRHCRRVTSDLQDARVLADSLQSRMHEVDRKQRRSVSTCSSRTGRLSATYDFLWPHLFILYILAPSLSTELQILCFFHVNYLSLTIPIQYDTIRYSVIRYAMIQYGRVQYGMIQ